MPLYIKLGYCIVEHYWPESYLSIILFRFVGYLLLYQQKPTKRIKMKYMYIKLYYDNITVSYTFIFINVCFYTCEIKGEHKNDSCVNGF